MYYEHCVSLLCGGQIVEVLFYSSFYTLVYLLIAEILFCPHSTDEIILCGQDNFVLCLKSAKTFLWCSKSRAQCHHFW